MKEIKMVDLIGQYQKIKSEIDAGIQEVIDNATFIKGPQVKRFEENLAKYLGAKHVIGCGNGTDALQIAMMALDLQPGDEVITPACTYAATVEVVALLRLTPVFVEVDEKTFTLDINAVRKAITPRTKAIVPVHLYGQCAHMEPLLEIAQEHKIYVIEDVAQAIGAEYIFSDGKRMKAGTMGLIGCTSFFPSKNLGCYGDGGALICNDDTLAEKIRMIANHGQRIQYHFDMVGVNSRLDSIQAAVLDVKLKYLDEYAAARRRVADFYDEAFSGMPELAVPYRAPYSTHVFHQYTLKIFKGNRDDLREFLKQRGIPTMVYYPHPLHLEKAYNPDGKWKKGDFPYSEWHSLNSVSLPIHTEFDEEVFGYIAQNVKEYFRSLN
ncbi:MAG: DegT/DnrJ/EryC1/StrS family aminotransferase [Chitinophagales bacterium]|nr:DegT/DnrJ/EryC1/StrS family aminotransferase [Chitinophagales bacterium]MDW8273073.1 DegT/DnrJ/EryC1/StrS family aminotransferase [Chitinophagales bacterium]